MSDKLLFAGQYTLDSIDIIQPNGVAVDVREQVEQITIYEDIFSPFISGNLICLDTADLPSLFLNAGADLLRLSVWTPTIDKSKRIDRYFHIYKLSDRAEISDRSQSYIFHFVSQESIVDTSFNFSRTFKSNGSANVKTILEKGLNSAVPLLTEPSMNDVVYTSNNWSPTKNIRYNCENSIAPDTTPSYVFFESRAGFEFQPLTVLAKKEPINKFYTSNHISTVKTEGVSASEVVADLSKDYNTIISMSAKVTYDYQRDKANGLMNSRQFAFDLTAKTFSDITYNANSDDRGRMNPNRFYTKEVINTSYRGSVGSVLLNNQRHNNLYDDSGDTTDVTFRQKRISILRQFRQHVVEIEVFGRTDYTVGETVDTDFNKLRLITEDTKASDVTDPLFSGKYLITAVCHRFTRDGKHICKLELSRDSIRNQK